MTKNTIYSSWAFTENEREKAKSNREAYNELQEKYKILTLPVNGHRQPTQEELDNYDIVYSRKACYHHAEYKVYKKPMEVTQLEMALICDQGNLCFGYTLGNGYYDFYVFED